MLAKSYLDDPRFANTPGTIKCKQYPTTRMLKQSRQGAFSSSNLLSSSGGEAAQSDRNVSGNDYIDGSDYSELIVATEQA